MKKSSFLPVLLSAVLLVLGLKLQAQTEEELKDLQIKIRREKMDVYLPILMRDREVDMWIQVIRPWDQDPMKVEFGCGSGIIIFTDLGEKGIERAVFEGEIDDPEVFDIILGGMEERSGGNAFEDGEPVEKPGGPETLLEFRFREIAPFVTERDPGKIALNYTEKLSYVSSLEFEPFSDGVSHTDFTLLKDALGEKYSQRIVSAEYLITDYLARRVNTEIEMYTRYGIEAAEIIKQEFDKIVVGKTLLSDLEGNVFFRLPDGTEVHAQDPEPHIIQGGELITLLNGAGNDVFHSDLGGLCYVLREGETEPPEFVTKSWEEAMRVREILYENIKPGISAGETLDLLIKKLEDAGFHYADMDRNGRGI